MKRKVFFSIILTTILLLTSQAYYFDEKEQIQSQEPQLTVPIMQSEPEIGKTLLEPDEPIEIQSSQRSTRNNDELKIDLKWLDGFGTIIGYLNSIKAADVDNDGETEIVFGNSEGYVYVVGDSETGYSEEWSTMVAIYAFGLSLGDVDNDGTVEIIVGDSEGYINIFGFNGTSYALEWTSPDLGSDLYGLTTDDIDNDGVVEIIAGASVEEIFEDNIFVYSWQGSSYEDEWSFALTTTLGYLGLFNIAVGDVDGDNFKEIVIGSFESEVIANDPPVNPIPPNPRPNGQFGGRFYVFGYSDGSGALEWQSDDFGEWIIGLCVNNTDDDSDLEIIVTVYLGEVYVFGYLALAYTQEWQSNGLSAYALTTGWIGHPFYSRIVISSWEKIIVYENSMGCYEEVWSSPDLDSFVYGLGIGDVDGDPIFYEILTGSNYRFYIHGSENIGSYVVEAESNNIGAIECICGADLDSDGLNEIYLGTGGGEVMVMEFNRVTWAVVDTISLSTITITHLAISDVDGDGVKEIIAVEGHAYVSWNENFIFRSSGGDSVVYIASYSGSGYTVENQITVDTGATFACDVGDVDEDGISEILLGGTGYDAANEDPFVGQIRVVDYDGSGYNVVWESQFYREWNMGVAIGDVDEDGKNELLGEDSYVDGNDEDRYILRLYEWNGNTYVQDDTIEIDSENYALDIGDSDNDGTLEMVTKGIFSGALEVFGNNSQDETTIYTQEWSTGAFTTFIDECISIASLIEGGAEYLIFGELGVFIYEFSEGTYQQIWHSPEIPASVKNLYVEDVDYYSGYEIIGSSGGYNFIYGDDKRPIAVLNVNDDTVEIGDTVRFDASQSTGETELEYFLDFGDGGSIGWTSSAFMVHGYYSEGTYTASLRVRDSLMVECKDASTVKITVLPLNSKPIAYIDSISHDLALKGQKVIFEGHGEDDNEVVAYNWHSSIDGDIGDTAYLETSQLSVGVHTIFFKVMDNENIWSNEVSRSIRVHEKPTAKIIDISPNPAIEGDMISFVGNATDDGEITEYEWNSSINGFISDALSFDFSGLSLGDHEITFRAMDDDDVWSNKAFVSLRVNQVPKARIKSINPNPASQGESVSFNGIGIDDGDIVEYSWRSSKDGFLSGSGSFSYAGLSVGEHIIYFKVKDEVGMWSEEDDMVLRINQIPTAHIDTISPNPAMVGELISFEGHGTDDGSITAYYWESNIDGSLNTRASFSTSSLSIGIHSISFQVKDNKGAWSEIVTGTLTVFDTPENEPPTALIESILPYKSEEGEYVTFIGRGVDEDGDVVEYYWESDLDGFLSDGRSFTTPDLSVGTHFITFRVKDDSGEWSEDIHATIVVKEAESEGFLSLIAANTLLWLLIIVILIVVIVSLIILSSRKRKKKEKEQVHYGFYKPDQK
ncbi:MAG: PKD domain-containing protein [Thermoplasmata archaeon]|nr:MAG: PKD domain-containing protein [Thermoplasmata archaeon]